MIEPVIYHCFFLIFNTFEAISILLGLAAVGPDLTWFCRRKLLSPSEMSPCAAGALTPLEEAWHGVAWRGGTKRWAQGERG